MNFIAIVYLIIGGMILFTLFILVMVIAGKDIILAFRRWFQKKGCDVFIANTNRNISHYYRVPKLNQFKIGTVTYYTNPDKTLNLSEQEKKRVLTFMNAKIARLNDRIQNLEQNKEKLKQLQNLEKDDRNKYVIGSQIENIEKLIATLNKKKERYQENYFKDKRPAFFYIEGDPIPKDFYEYYSNLDSKIVDNIVSRKITDAPQTRTEKVVSEQKYWLLAAILAAGIAAFLSYRCYTMIKEICISMGLQCAL